MKAAFRCCLRCSCGSHTDDGRWTRRTTHKAVRRPSRPRKRRRHRYQVRSSGDRAWLRSLPLPSPSLLRPQSLLVLSPHVLPDERFLRAHSRSRHAASLLRTKHLQACRSTVEDLTQECALQPRRGSWRSSQASRQQQLRLPRPACARRSPRLASVGPCSARLAARPNAERHTGVQAWCKCTADVQGSTCGCC